MQEKICMQCYVSGKVQGVFFRASTQDQANILDVKGYAKNLTDGRVEVIVCGDKEKVMQLCEWLKLGPEKAEVINLEMKAIPWQEHSRFAVK